VLKLVILKVELMVIQKVVQKEYLKGNQMVEK
jgi:hypothetical protein